MQKVSIKKLSILGLVLMGASAVTAAIIPSASAPQKTNNDNATLLAVSNDGAGAILSCVADDDSFRSCTLTAASAAATTAGAAGNSFVGTQDQTTRNTSQTLSPIGTPNDPTSHVI